MPGRSYLHNATPLILICWLFTACAPSVPRVKRVTELAPPTRVSLNYDKSNTRRVKLSWSPSPDHNRDDFAGYSIYVADRSLVMAPAKELPDPLIVSKPDTSAVVPNLDFETKYFLHVRSRQRNGDLSLPSLPEITFTTN